MFYAISLCYPENRFLSILDIECAEMQTCFPMQNNLDMKCELGTPSNIAASICQKSDYKTSTPQQIVQFGHHHMQSFIMELVPGLIASGRTKRQ